MRVTADMSSPNVLAQLNSTPPTDKQGRRGAGLGAGRGRLRRNGKGRAAKLVEPPGATGLMSASALNAMIAKLYQAKVVADSWIDGSKKTKGGKDGVALKPGEQRVGQDRNRSIQGFPSASHCHSHHLHLHFTNPPINHLHHPCPDAPIPAPNPTRSSPDQVRFDKFVVQHFFQAHGTRGVARRHLRAFVTSIQHFAALDAVAVADVAVPVMEEAGGAPREREHHPRIAVFCVLAGLQPQLTAPVAGGPEGEGDVVLPSFTPDDSVQYSPRLMTQYFLPAIRQLYPDARRLEAMLSNRDHSGTHLFSRARLIKVIIEKCTNIDTTSSIVPMQ